MRARGKLITIEGLDGAGKSTLACALLEHLQERHIPAELLREPGSEPLAERIRALLAQPELKGHLSARAEALLYAAARAQLTERKLTPMLASGTWVLLDRFTDSSLAYQGGGRGLGIEHVRALNRFATGDVQPDRTLLLTITPSAARARRSTRDAQADRLELERDTFFADIATTYERLARAEPDRIRQIDGLQRPRQVLACALSALADLLDQQAHASF